LLKDTQTIHSNSVMPGLQYTTTQVSHYAHPLLYVTKPFKRREEAHLTLH